MRIFVLFVLISLSTAQSYFNQDFNPAFQPPQDHQQHSQPGPFNRILNWFRPAEPQPMAAASEVPDPVRAEAYESSMPVEATDRMINDAISERILQESRLQQKVLGSPFKEEKPEVDIEPTPSASEDKQIAVDREGYGKSVASGPTDTIPIVEALRIVSSSKLTDCVARVICELSCNANAYGNPGRVVFRNMIKLQFDQSIKGDDAKFFRQSAAKGRQIVQAKRDCKECYTIYPSCESDSNDLVAVSSMFKL